MRAKYKVTLGLSVVALLIFIRLTVHTVSAFARNALSIMGEFLNYIVYAAPFAITASIVYVEATSSSKMTTKGKFVFGLSATALLVLTGLAMHSVSVHVTDATQSGNDLVIMSFASTVSATLLDMVITEIPEMEYRAVMAMVVLGIALLLLTAGLLWHIAWALGKGLMVGFDFKALQASCVISAFDTIGLEVFYLSGFI